MTQKEIKKKIEHCFKMISIHTKLLKSLHEMALLNKDFDRIQFEQMLKENLKQENLGLGDMDVERIIDVANIMVEWEKKEQHNNKPT